MTCHILIIEMPHSDFNKNSTYMPLTICQVRYQLCSSSLPSHTLQSHTYHSGAFNVGIVGPTSQMMKLKFKTNKNISQYCTPTTHNNQGIENDVGHTIHKVSPKLCNQTTRKKKYSFTPA